MLQSVSPRRTTTPAGWSAGAGSSPAGSRAVAVPEVAAGPSSGRARPLEGRWRPGRRPRNPCRRRRRCWERTRGCPRGAAPLSAGRPSVRQSGRSRGRRGVRRRGGRPRCVTRTRDRCLPRRGGARGQSTPERGADHDGGHPAAERGGDLLRHPSGGGTHASWQMRQDGEQDAHRQPGRDGQPQDGGQERERLVRAQGHRRAGLVARVPTTRVSHHASTVATPAASRPPPAARALRRVGVAATAGCAVDGQHRRSGVVRVCGPPLLM